VEAVRGARLDLGDTPNEEEALQRASCNASTTLLKLPLSGRMLRAYSYASWRMAQSKLCGTPVGMPSDGGSLTTPVVMFAVVGFLIGI
jgi:hypothetical protein